MCFCGDVAPRLRTPDLVKIELRRGGSTLLAGGPIVSCSAMKLSTDCRERLSSFFQSPRNAGRHQECGVSARLTECLRCIKGSSKNIVGRR